MSYEQAYAYAVLYCVLIGNPSEEAVDCVADMYFDEFGIRDVPYDDDDPSWARYEWASVLVVAKGACWRVDNHMDRAARRLDDGMFYPDDVPF